MGVLTEANYQSRRISRQREIAAAQERYNTVAFAHELDEATREDVAAAKADLVELTDRLSALDMAWAKRKEQVTAEGEAAQIAARQAAVAKVEQLLTARTKAAKAIEKAAAALISAYEEFKQNGPAIVAAVAPVAVHLGRDGMQFLRGDATGQFGSPDFLIAGLLRNGGMEFSGIDTGIAGFRVLEQGVEAFVTAHSEQIRRRVQDIAPRDEA
jgi:hypothetical protein